MLLKLKKNDGAVEHIEVLEGRFACEIAAAFDWEGERMHYDLREIDGEHRQMPAMEFINDAGRSLEFGPNYDGTFWVSYRYLILKSTFGVFPVDHRQEQRWESCTLDAALGLLLYHYGSEHRRLVDLLPPEAERKDPPAPEF